MKPYSIIRLYGVIIAFVLLSPYYGAAQAVAVTRFPADRAVGVNPDTHLVLTFATAPTLGKSGPVSKQLTMPQDAQTIANYSNPTFVLGGWTPTLDQ